MPRSLFYRGRQRKTEIKVRSKKMEKISNGGIWGSYIGYMGE